ncbi:hypothetical protein D049_0352A, partial [Vibrio parahaemolyticus VPTS-2010]
MPGEKPERES